MFVYLSLSFCIMIIQRKPFLRHQQPLCVKIKISWTHYRQKQIKSPYSIQWKNIRIQYFQFRPQTPCRKGIAAEGTVLQPRSWSFMKGVRCFSPFSPQKQFRTWYRSRYQMVPLSVSESTIPQVSQHHSRSWKSPHILFIPTQAFR